MYQPGLHILATLETDNTEFLRTCDAFQHKIKQLVHDFHLVNLGEVFHNFQPHGFTAVVCLSESHISIHTWPEYKRLNLDIYLSNFEQVNNHVVEDIFSACVVFFDARIIHQEKIIR